MKYYNFRLLIIFFIILFFSIPTEFVSAQQVENATLIFLDDGEIYTYKTSSQEKELFVSGSNYLKFDISDSGNWVLGYKKNNYLTDMYLINVNSKVIKNFKEIFYVSSHERDTPKISPDDSKVVYKVGTLPKQLTTIIATLDGTILNEFSFQMDFPHWGNDSQTLYYFRIVDDEYTFSKFDISTQQHNIIYSFPKNTYENFYPVFVYYSNNSSLVAVASQYLTAYEGELIFISKDGNLDPIRKRITGYTLLINGLGEWSPDGKTFAYHQPGDSGYKWYRSLVIFTPSNDHPDDGWTTSKGEPAYANPRWSLDGKYLSFVNQNGVYGIYKIDEDKFTLFNYEVNNNVILEDSSFALNSSGASIDSYDSYWSPNSNWLILSYPGTRIVDINTGNVQILEGAKNARWLTSEIIESPIQTSTPLTESTPLPIDENSSFFSGNWISYVGIDNNIWLIKPDGSENHQITTDANTKSYYQKLNWSSDGKKLAFQKYNKDDRQIDIFVYDLTQDTLIKAVDRSQTAGGFDWYQDSDHIIFDRPAKSITKESYGATCTVGYTNNDGLYIVTLSTGEQNQFINLTGELPIRNPNVSPDNNSIIFDFLQPLENNLDQFIMLIDNPSAFREITAVQSDCDWNPDSSMIACGAWDGIVKYPAESEFRPLSIFTQSGEFQYFIPSEIKSFDDSPIWSPSGEYVAFRTTEASGGYADGPCGGGAQPVGNLSFINFRVDVFSPVSNSRFTVGDGKINSWSSDSSRLLVSSNDSEGDFIHIVDIKTKESFFLVNGNEAAWQPTRIPPAVKDLSIKPGENKDEFFLSWTYILDPLLGIDIDTLEIRYHSDPITDKNWSESTVLYSIESSNSLANHWEITITSKNITPYKNWYFSARTESKGIWSPITNVRFIDTGFRNNSDSYPFYNYRGVNYDDVTVDIVKSMFSTDLINICKVWTFLMDKDCELKDTVEQWRIDVNEKLNNGRCLGMASTSQYYFKNENDLYKKYNTNNLFNIIEVNPDPIPLPIRQDIARYQIVQWSQPFWNDYDTSRIHKTPNDVISDIQKSMLESTSDPLILIMNSPSINFSHAVAPIALEQNGSGLWRVWVYENSESRQGFILEVNTISNEWVLYNSKMEPYASGNDSTNTLFTIPISYLYGEQRFPSNKAPYDDYSWFFGKVKTIISDPFGNQIGYVDDYFVNTITGAVAIPTINNITESSMPTFILPSNQDYTIYLEGLEAESDPNVGGLSYFSQDEVFSLKQVLLSENVQELIKINMDENLFEYENALDQEFSLSYSSDNDVQGLKLNIFQIALPANNLFSFSYDEVNEIIKINQSATGSYIIEVIYTSENQNKNFTSKQIDLLEGETHYLNVNTWKEGKFLDLEIDENSDGTINQTINLRNNPLSLDNSGNKILGYLLLGFGLLIILFSVFGYLYFNRSSSR